MAPVALGVDPLVTAPAVGSVVVEIPGDPVGKDKNAEAARRKAELDAKMAARQQEAAEKRAKAKAKAAALKAAAAAGAVPDPPAA